MKKGFTLVELLAVITIIGIIALIIIPTVMKSIERSEQRLYEIQIGDIESTGKKWATDHMEFLDDTHINTIAVSLRSLILSDYLQKSNVLDPRDKSQMNGCITIKYNNNTNQYQYHYVEETCENAIENGYIYRYENANWLRTDQNVIQSAANAIINQYASRSLIKTMGQTTAGFYDVEDRYIFRGDNVDNYVKLEGGTEMYRILSIEKSTGNIRLMGTTAIPNAWDNNNGVIFENASATTVQLASYYSSSSNGILNNELKVEKDAVWNVGKITDSSSYSVLKSLETGRTSYSKIGLPSISDYVGASTDLACTDNIFSETCKQQNYLYELWKTKNTWTINTDETSVWYVNASGLLDRASSNSIFYLYPVVEIKPSAFISKGEGKSTNPYIFS